MALFSPSFNCHIKTAFLRKLSFVFELFFDGVQLSQVDHPARRLSRRHRRRHRRGAAAQETAQVVLEEVSRQLITIKHIFLSADLLS